MMDKHLEQQIIFLENAGWASSKIELLAADASFRSYHRVKLNDRLAVLMDAPPPEEDIRPFITIGKYLSQLGFSAPRIYAEDERRGFLLLEDLGDNTYTRVFATGGDEEMLYELAIDTLIQLHELSSATTVPADTAPYDLSRLMTEVALIADWYLPAVGISLSDDARSSFDTVWQSAFAQVADKQETLVLRDYHVDNLMWLPHRTDTARCGLLDFQDALVGARAYDLMSLIEDARRDVPTARADKMIKRYLDACDDIDEQTLRQDIAILGAGRHAKAIGIFTRLAERDGKSQYLDHIQRVWGLLENSLQHPALADVQSWFNAHVPKDQRIIPSIKTV